MCAPAGKFTLTGDMIVEDDGLPIPVVPDAIRHRVEDLPDECLQFLLASRYCEVDKLTDFAWELSAKLPLWDGRRRRRSATGYTTMSPLATSARPTKTAYDVFGTAGASAVTFSTSPSRSAAV